MINKPAPPRSHVWSRVKRPDIVTKIVLFGAIAYGVCFAGFAALLYVLLRWLAFPDLPLAATAFVALVAGAAGFALGFRTATLTVHLALHLPDDGQA